MDIICIQVLEKNGVSNDDICRYRCQNLIFNGILDSKQGSTGNWDSQALKCVPTLHLSKEAFESSKRMKHKVKG